MVNKVDETVIDFFTVLLKDSKRSQLKFAEPEDTSLEEKYCDKKHTLQNLLSTIKSEENECSVVEPLQESNLEEKVLHSKNIEVEPEQNRVLADNLEQEFQVLYFSVAGLILAVPLVSLGGIVNVSNCTKLPGRPNWFRGVQTNREQKINVVDTAAWVMPEKYTDELKESISYEYVVLLEGSDWGLACESLMSAETIDKTKVNWRQKTGKRPWLAGVVKDKMCGILNVGALTFMLDKGLNCQDSIN